MQKLASYIARELRADCAVYEPELDRVWPNSTDREKLMRQFAEMHGFRLRFYKEGLVAIFDKEASRADACN